MRQSFATVLICSIPFIFFFLDDADFGGIDQLSLRFGAFVIACHGSRVEISVSRDKTYVTGNSWYA